MKRYNITSVSHLGAPLGAPLGTSTIDVESPAGEYVRYVDVSEMAKDAERWRAMVAKEYAKHLASCLDGFAEHLYITEFTRLYNESFDRPIQTEVDDAIKQHNKITKET